MRLKLLRLLMAVGCFIFFSGTVGAQNCIPTNINGAVINLNCNQVCSTLVFPVPHIKSSDDYTLVTVPYTPYPYITPTGTQDPVLYADDQYSFLVNLPFTFCFYGATYPSTVVGSNGIITFDPANANCANAWPITQPIPYAGGTICSSGSTYYPQASIMGAYSDLDPRTVASPADRLIQWDVFGTAPCRKFVVSYYHIGVYGNNACGQATPNTFQMVIHESTGIVEVFTEQKACASATNAGRGILGMQNWNRDLAIWAPGKNNTFWSENNTGYRFIPSAGTSRYVSSQLYTITNTFVMNGDTATTTPGILDIRFPNACFPPGSNQYIVRTTFSACDNPATLLISNDTITVNRTNNLNATSTATNTGCGAPSGTITVTVPAGVGTPPYTYILDGGAPITGPSPYTFTNVAQGPHNIVITDASAGCTSTLSQPVGLTGTISETHTTTPAACVGSNTGSITITSASGIGPYTFSLDGAPAVAGTIPYTFTNLTATTHTVVVNDIGTGCNSGPVSITVITGPGVTGNTTNTATACPGINNGTITVTALTGVGPFTWSLDGAPGVAGASPYTFTNVSAGSHNVVIMDNIGCVSSPIPVNIATGVGVNGTTTTSATSCPTATNGSITVTVTTGTAPFTFSLDGGAPVNGGSPYTFINVAAGTHNIIITDNVGCTLPLNNVIVNAGPPLSGNVVVASTNCNGATDGSITVTPLGGTAPFTFSLDGGVPQSGGAPYTFINVPSGPHTVVIADVIGCISNPIPADVTAGPQLVTTASSTPALCNGSATGSITVAVPTIGTAPYQYSLDNITWQASNVFNGLVANTYTVYYRSANGCQGTPLPVIVSAPSSVSATLSTTAVTCNGLSDGIITINASGGVPPYQYSIDGGAIWQGSNIFSVPANTYNILIRDANNCVLPQTAIVTEPAPLAVSLNTTNATCNGGSNGTITVNVSGGNSGYQYSLDAVNFQSSNVFNVTANTYTVTVKDNLGCTASSGITVGLTNDLTFTPQVDATICEGTSTQLGLTSNAIQYSWTPATGLSSTTIPNPVANPTVTTTYTVMATLGVCTATDDVTVNVNAAPVPDAGPDGDICYGQSYTLQGSGGTQYIWTPSTYLNNPNINNPISTPVKTITYTLSEVRDAIGCKSLVTDDVTVNVTPPIKVLTFPFDTVAYAGDQFQLNATSIANTYTWSPSTGLSNPTIANPVVTIGPVGSDVVYRVIASTAAGCRGEGYVRIKVYTGPDIYMPTGFTPNADGKNDKLTPFPVGIASIKYFRVFNRWGQLVFSTNKLNDGWDGKLGGIEQPLGVYVWVVEGTTKANKVINKKGTVTLIR